MIDNLIVGLAVCGLLAFWIVMIYYLGFALTLLIVGSLMFMNGVLHGHITGEK
jgi:hypothetical protein